MRVKAISGAWPYAAGDVNHRALLTHMGKYQARVCRDAIVARATSGLESSISAPWSRYAAGSFSIGGKEVIFPLSAAIFLLKFSLCLSRQQHRR